MRAVTRCSIARPARVSTNRQVASRVPCAIRAQAGGTRLTLVQIGKPPKSTSGAAAAEPIDTDAASATTTILSNGRLLSVMHRRGSAGPSACRHTSRKRSVYPYLRTGTPAGPRRALAYRRRYDVAGADAEGSKLSLAKPCEVCVIRIRPLQA
jgi:hypothetical protein